MQITPSKLYDRQIQIFGKDTQQDISSTEVVIIGINTATAETAKNLILTGFCVALYDKRPITKEYMDCSPLLGECHYTKIGHCIDDVIASRLLEINPRTGIRVLEEVSLSSVHEHTRILICSDQSFESALEISLTFKNVHILKLYVFTYSSKFIVFSEQSDKTFDLCNFTTASLSAKLLHDTGLMYDFEAEHEPDFLTYHYHCIFGATLNSMLLTYTMSKDLYYNTLYIDVNGSWADPVRHRRQECLLLK